MDGRGNGCDRSPNTTRPRPLGESRRPGAWARRYPRRCAAHPPRHAGTAAWFAEASLYCSSASQTTRRSDFGRRGHWPVRRQREPGGEQRPDDEQQTAAATATSTRRKRREPAPPTCAARVGGADGKRAAAVFRDAGQRAQDKLEAAAGGSRRRPSGQGLRSCRTCRRGVRMRAQVRLDRQRREWPGRGCSANNQRGVRPSAQAWRRGEYGPGLLEAHQGGV